MTFFQPIILASEFIQHVVVIVLVGLVLTECVACWHDLQMSRKGLFDIEQDRRFHKRKREHLELLAVMSLTALWLIVEYFADLSHVSYHFLFHAPIVLAILWLLREIIKSYGGALTILFAILVLVVGAHLFLDVLKFLLHIYFPSDPIVRAALKTAEAVVLYFLVIRYMIISQKQ